MFKVVIGYLQSRSATRALTILLEKHRHISKVSNLECSKLSAHIIKKEWSSLNSIGSKHLAHHFSVVIYCVGNVINKIANNPAHPAAEELLMMYMTIENEIMEVVLHPSAEEHFKLTKLDHEIIDFVIQQLSNVTVKEL